MKAVIIGVGAIGGWIAGLLAESGAEVSLLARGQTLAALRDNGLRIRRGDDEKHYALHASDDPAALGRPDFVFIGVKGQSVPHIAPAVAALCGPQTAVIPAVNGVPWWFFDVDGVPFAHTALASVDPGGVTARAIATSRVIGCVVHASAFTPESGVVQVNGEDKLIFGEPDGAGSKRVDALVNAVTHGPLKGVASDHIRADIWLKLWGNMSMNPLSVLTMASTGDMLDNDDVRALVRVMMQEMQTIGKKIGLPLDMTPDDRMAITQKLGSFKTSMLRDAEAGRPIEIDPILGVLAEIAEIVDVPAPSLRTVLGLLRVRGAQI